jgi:hypothetical protein
MATKKFIPVIILVVFLMVSVPMILLNQGISAQNQGKDSINNPDVHISVNKKTDEKGNITEYDSTYTYSYHSKNSNEAVFDSIMHNFQNQFDLHKFGHNFMDEDFKNNFFSNSPLANDSNFHHFGDFDRMMHAHMVDMMKEQEEMMKMLFNDDLFRNEPILKVPEGVVPDKKEQRPDPKKEKYSPVVEL